MAIHSDRSARTNVAVIAATFALAAVGPHAAAADGPDAQVLAGKDLYNNVAGIGCTACHGLYGEGDVGPYNRGTTLESIQAAMDGIEDMNFLREELSQEDLEAIAAYTEWLGNTSLVKVLLKRGRFVPGEIAFPAGASVQLVVSSSALEPVNVASEGLDFALEVPARDEASDFLQTPENSGTFEIECIDCGTRSFPLVVTIGN